MLQVHVAVTKQQTGSPNRKTNSSILAIAYLNNTMQYRGRYYNHQYYNYNCGSDWRL